MSFPFTTSEELLGTKENYKLLLEEIKTRLNSGNACYHPVRVICFPICFVFCKNLKFKIYKPQFYLLFYGCESCSVTVIEELRLRASENMLLRKIIGPKREEVAGGWRRLHNF
jgi:hypothetical protein